MAWELTAGLLVNDREQYARYRHEIAPLLAAAGSRFRYDFEVARTLTGEAGHEINRLFVLQFSDRDSRDRFFADPRYIEIRARLFETAVEGWVTVAEYQL